MNNNTFPAESFANWLFGEVDGALDPDLQDHEHLTGADLKKENVGKLLALMFDAGQPAVTRCAAIDTLRERYDADQKARYSPERCAELEAIMGDVIKQFNALTIRGAL